MDSKTKQLLLNHYSHKELSARFDRQEFTLFLSQALFSSHEIDQGSRLLLKSLAAEADFKHITSLLDIGCGVGTLGLALKKRHPGIRAVLQDRDALAAAFSRINAGCNGIDDTVILGGLAFQDLGHQSFDLIVSNVPAKVGAPVLRFFYEKIREGLSDHGMAAIVVVNQIADLTLSVLSSVQARILYRESAASHTVIHFDRGEIDRRASCSAENREIIPQGPLPAGIQREKDLAELAENLRPYFRSRLRFSVGRTAYTLDTVWGEADFDTPPYTARLTARVLSSIHPGEELLFWNTGQGHIPVMTTLQTRGKGLVPKRIVCAGRDMLALQITCHNLTLCTDRDTDIRLLHIPDPGLLDTAETGICSLFVLKCENLSGVPGPRAVFSAAARVLRQNGILLIAGKSAHVHNYKHREYPFTLITEKKHHGYRVVALKRL